MPTKDGQLVTHPSTNQTQCRVTLLIETNALLLHYSALCLLPKQLQNLASCVLYVDGCDTSQVSLLCVCEVFVYLVSSSL